MNNLVVMPQRGPVQETLRDAMEKDFERVIVVGWKEGQVWLCASQQSNRLEWMGALAAAQIELWNE